MVGKEDWIRNLSRQAAICPGPKSLLDQVYFPWVGLMSSSSQSRMISSTHSLAGSLTGEPPFFSLVARVRLRSPAMITFYGLCVLRKDFKASQHDLFSENETGTYKLNRLTWWPDSLWRSLVKIQCILLSSDVSLNLEVSQKVVIPPDAPLELIDFTWTFFQNTLLAWRRTTSSNFVSWMRRTSGLYNLTMSFKASSFRFLPRPLQFQETYFIIYLGRMWLLLEPSQDFL